MLKFYLQIDWILLTYTSSPTKNHSINITLQNEQGEQLTFERKMISAQQNTYDLDTLSPFQLHMIIGQNNHKYCPFKLQLISKMKHPIKRQIDLQLSDLFNHYLKHQLFADIQPLIQVFSFQDGQLTYRVTISQVETVTDTEEFLHLKSQLSKTDSLQTEGKARGSQLTTEDQVSKESSVIEESMPERQRLYLAESADIKIQVNAIKMKKMQSMASLSFEELADRVQQQAKKKKHQFQMESQIYQTKVWYIKLGKQNNSHSQHEGEHSGWSMKIKILALLILLGISLLIYSLNGDDDKRSGVSSKQRRQKKSKHSKVQKKGKKSAIKSK